MILRQRHELRYERMIDFMKWARAAPQRRVQWREAHCTREARPRYHQEYDCD